VGEHNPVVATPPLRVLGWGVSDKDSQQEHWSIWGPEVGTVDVICRKERAGQDWEINSSEKARVMTGEDYHRRVWC